MSQSLDIVGLSLGIQGALADLNAIVAAHAIQIELDADVLFDFDKYSRRAEARGRLRELAEVAKNYGIAPVLIEGYTDGKGARDYNMKLSHNRAEHQAGWL